MCIVRLHKHAPLPLYLYCILYAYILIGVHDIPGQVSNDFEFLLYAKGFLPTFITAFISHCS